MGKPQGGAAVLQACNIAKHIENGAFWCKRCIRSTSSGQVALHGASRRGPFAGGGCPFDGSSHRS